MTAVLRHLVSSAALTAGLPALPAPEENGPLPGSPGGIPRPALAALSGSEWAALADGAVAEDAETEGGEEGEGEYEESEEEAAGIAGQAIETISEDMLLSWEDLKDLPNRDVYEDEERAAVRRRLEIEKAERDAALNGGFAALRSHWDPEDGERPLVNPYDDSPEDDEEEFLEGPQRVWVLFGGDAAERQESLANGRAAWLALAAHSGGAAEAFVMEPGQFSGRREPERRRTLLRKRNELLAIGDAEETLPPELQLQNIREPPEDDRDVAQRGVWALSYSGPLLGTVEEVVETADRAAAAAAVIRRVRSAVSRGREDVTQLTMRELDYAGVAGVGAAWGGDAATAPPVPRYMDLETFAAEALAADAVVVIAVQGGVGQNGVLQAFFEMHGVPFTGSGSLSASVCDDPLATAEQLAELYHSGITVAPKHVLPAAQLARAIESEEDAAKLLEELRGLVGTPGALSIRPVGGGSRRGVVRVDTAVDLGWLARAVDEHWARIPADTLSALPAAVEMPRYKLDAVVVEPYAQTDSVVLMEPEGGGPPELTWVGDGQWLEASFTVLGDVGAMRVLQPTLRVRHADRDGKLQAWPVVALTPPPEELISAASVREARSRVQMVADRLALAGAAVVNTFVSVANGDIVVVDVNCVPDFVPGAPLLQQGLVEDPPLYPDHLLHEIIRTALQPAPQNVAFGEEPGFSGFNDGEFAGPDPSDWRRGSLEFEDEYGTELEPVNGQGGGSRSALDRRQGFGAEDYPDWPERGGFSEAQQLSFNSDR